MFKKLLAVICALSLMSACASKEQGADLYGNGRGGWSDDVNVMELKATGFTKQFKDETTPTIYFAFNASSLDGAAKDTLKEQIAWLKANPRALVVIEGRCDERGTREYNLALGERRANAVRSFMIANGISASRIKTISYGKEKPVAAGSNEAAWAKNRNATTVAY